MQSFVSGSILGFGLVTSIGPQNLFLARQALSNRYPYSAAVTCVICDWLVILCGVYSSQWLSNQFASFDFWLAWGGSIFLLVMGVGAVLQALQPVSLQIVAGDGVVSRGRILLAACGFSLFNPAAYLDAFAIIGKAALNIAAVDRELFLIGVCLASGLWFPGLVTGFRLSSGLFKKPRAWQGLNLVSGLVLLFFGIRLLPIG